MSDISKWIPRTCLNCKKEFLAKLCETRRRGGVKFCSRECHKEDERKNHSKSIRRVCKTCGSEFFIYPSKLARSAANYCSQKCHGRGRVWKPENFWNKVNKTESCWLWTGSKDKKGYGYSSFTGERHPIAAYRISWILAHGPIPDGLFVCHNCPGGDNPSCVNPSHLFLGTRQDNVDDAVRKGQVRSGGDHPWSTVTKSQVLEIRSKYKPWKYTQDMLAKEYGVGQGCIEGIVRRISWKHI